MKAPRLQEKYNKEIIPAMKKKFGYLNVLAVPRILKVVVNTGVGRLRDDKQVEEVVKFLSMITGQKPVPRPAKKAIASFKTRIGMVVGYKVTLRGRMMYEFLERFISATMPRMRDFHGLPAKGIDQGGSLTVGVKEHIIFPETINEDIRTIFGLEITVVTNAKSRQEAEELFRLMGFPLKKQDT